MKPWSGNQETRDLSVIAATKLEDPGQDRASLSLGFLHLPNGTIIPGLSIPQDGPFARGGLKTKEAGWGEERCRGCKQVSQHRDGQQQDVFFSWAGPAHLRGWPSRASSSGPDCE